MPVPWLSNLGVRGRAPRRQPALQPTNSAEDQCLKDRRIGELETLQTKIAAWSKSVNDKQRAVDWQFTIEKASKS
ncbi:MAG: hypothetical protein WD060_10795, partial [Pirellulales bacterium]